MTSKNINKCGAIYMSAIAAFFRIGYNMYNNKLGTIQVLLQQIRRGGGGNLYKNKQIFMFLKCVL